MTGFAGERIARIRADEVRPGHRVSYCGVYHTCSAVERMPSKHVRITMRGTPPMISGVWRELRPDEMVLVLGEIETDAFRRAGGEA